MRPTAGVNIIFSNPGSVAPAKPLGWIGSLLAGSWNYSREFALVVPIATVGLRYTDPGDGPLLRVYGSVGDGSFGVRFLGVTCGLNKSGAEVTNYNGFRVRPGAQELNSIIQGWYYTKTDREYCDSGT
jgi:hypothetical protein